MSPCQPDWVLRELKKITSEPMLTGSQIRMARGHLRWSVKDLAEASGVSTATIKRMEDVDGIPKAITDNLSKIKTTLESHGLIFIPENGGGAGLRMRKPSEGGSAQ